MNESRQQEEAMMPTQVRLPVGLIYDNRMCGHYDPSGDFHPECPRRIRAIWKKLQDEGITSRCVIINSKEAKDDDILTVHEEKHINLIKRISSKEFDSKRSKISSTFDSIYFNKGSSLAAYLAAGSVVEACDRVARGNLSSAIAIVRPPGHHAEPHEPMGFCLFNNVSIAANVLLNKRPEFGIKKILIVDWDVHHGNGTQNMFYKDPRVLFFSVHRFDSGTFYPSGGDGHYCMVGDGPGTGYNVNVPWKQGLCGDADYNAVWDHVLIPIAEDYNPDIILVSAGFDAAIGDPLGGCCVTPYGYSLMLRKLMCFAQGKIVLALEGGYNIDSLANSVLACAKTLTEDEPILGSIDKMPFESTWHVIQEVRQELKTYWHVLEDVLPHPIIVNEHKPPSTQLDPNSCSDSDLENREDSEFGSFSTFVEADEYVEPFSRLHVGDDNSGEIPSNPLLFEERPTVAATSPKTAPDTCVSWRTVLSKIKVWYASYGSNMWKERFLCYIEGGKVEGMSEPCCGSRDGTLPSDVIWKTMPHRLFFGRSHTSMWGTGGVAFLHPESNTSERAFMCMYKITLEQFNDLLLQENISQESESPILDLSDLDFLTKNKSKTLEALKGGWYSNVLFLGREDDLPILTMTCPLSDLEGFKSGHIPICSPSNEYSNSLARGLITGMRLSEAEATLYINDAAAKKL